MKYNISNILLNGETGKKETKIVHNLKRGVIFWILQNSRFAFKNNIFIVLTTQLNQNS